MYLAYRIDYTESCNDAKKHTFVPRILITMVSFLIFLMLVTQFWPKGKEVLQLMMIPGAPDTTMEAAETFVAELGCGSSLKAAVFDFWDKLTENDTIP